VAGIRVPVLAGGAVDRAHIPQERGGAPGGVVACSWEGVELVRAEDEPTSTVMRLMSDSNSARTIAQRLQLI